MLGTVNEVLTLSADESQHLHWHIDAAFRVHPNIRSHTGGTFSMSLGATSSSLTKQKVNSRSSTEEELLVIDDKISKVTWSKGLRKLKVSK